MSFIDDTARIEAAQQTLARDVLGSQNRMPIDRQRDSIRAPLDVMRLLDVKKSDRVLDFMSWDGYWATMMASLTSLPVWCQNEDRWKHGSDPAIQQRLALTDKTQNPNGTNPYGPLRFFYSDFGNPTPPVPPMCSSPTCTGCRQEWAGWDNMFDLIFTYGNYHDSLAELGGHEDMTSFNAIAYRLLRPGGKLVIVDFAAVDGTGGTHCRSLHRIDEAGVVAEVSSAGFELEDSEGVLRVPSDARVEGVAALAGNADRFFLKFVKPGGPEQSRSALICTLGHW